MAVGAVLQQIVIFLLDKAKVMKRKSKYFILDRSDTKDSVSVDKLKSAYLDLLDEKTPTDTPQSLHPNPSFSVSLLSDNVHYSNTSAQFASKDTVQPSSLSAQFPLQDIINFTILPISIQTF